MNNILLITAIFGFVLTSLLLFKVKNSTNTKATIYLGCFYFIISIYALQTFIVEAGYLPKFQWFFLWPLALYHLITVPIYFYFETVLDDRFSWKGRYWLLFVPFFLGVVDVIAVYVSPSTVYHQLSYNAITDTENRFEAHYWLMDLYEHYLIRHIWQAVFLLVLLPKLRRFLKEGATDRLKLALNKWLVFFWSILILMSLMAILHATEKWLDISVFNYFFGLENGSMIVTMVLYLVVFAIGVIPIYFPMILHGYPRPRKLPTTINKVADPARVQAPELKFSLDEGEIKRKLEYLHQNKLYLDLEFNVSKCARELEMPAHHLSYFINQFYGLSFTSYKNKLRIEHAKNLIQNGFLQNNSMDALAEACGFGNRSSFSKVFKSLEGLSPSEYPGNSQK